jgi:cytochrome c peroxidase
MSFASLSFRSLSGRASPAVNREISAARRTSRKRSCLWLYRLFCLIVAGAALGTPDASRAQDRGRRLSSSAPEVVLGDRLFFETRFAEYFFAHSAGDVNAPLAQGDPLVDMVVRPQQQPLMGPFRGQSISCRHCHLGDDFMAVDPLAQRTYSDFLARSLIPLRNDGLTHTVRNSPMMVDFGLPVEVPRLLHLDGEFAHAEDLIVDTLTGRNMGWLFEEYGLATRHIARVVREDSGENARHVLDRQGNGIPYRTVMLGGDASLPPSLRIPLQYRLDVANASDVEVLSAVARLIHAYMDSIRFGTEDTARARGAPYDLFLAKNGLPLGPLDGETNRAYAKRLRTSIGERKHFNWVTPQDDGRFELHSQAYSFGEIELAGLKLFLGEQRPSRANCAECHPPPQFTDHLLHNTGVSQIEYDALFGVGAFASLYVPDLGARIARPDMYLPASRRHPRAVSRFRSAPSKERPGFVDLGVWNIYANSDFPQPQAALNAILCTGATATEKPCTQEAILPTTIALFKTPSIRDLGHSEPYFHSGAAKTIEEVLLHYLRVSELARSEDVRNASPHLLEVRLRVSDLAPLSAFLRSLNEDYH